jgi:transposase
VYDVTKLLPKSQFQQLEKLLPTPRQKRYGRRRDTKEALLTGILQVLVNGVAWEKIADCGASPASCWRYLEELQRRGKLKLIFQALAKAKIDLTSCAIDTTLVISFHFRYMTGWSGKHRQVGTKVSLIVGKDGLPADVLFGKGSDRDTVFVEDHVKNVAGRRKKVLDLDMLYTSVTFRRAMRKKGIRINMQTRRPDYRHKRGPKFRYDKQNALTRFELERTNGWVKDFRALRLRRSAHPAMFKGMVYMALIVILVRYSEF